MISSQNKKGQFFLISALIIITILLSFVTLRSKIQITPVREKVYDIGEELNLESAEVLDYGIYSKNKQNLDEIFQNWIANFSEYSGDLKQDIIFIYSDGENIRGFRVGNEDTGGVGIYDNGRSMGNPQGQTVMTEITDLQEGNIQITIGDFTTEVDYDPNERDFYFILTSGGGEVAQN